MEENLISDCCVEERLLEQSASKGMEQARPKKDQRLRRVDKAGPGLTKKGSE